LGEKEDEEAQEMEEQEDGEEEGSAVRRGREVAGVVVACSNDHAN
jgi:hypothetical protein